MSHFISDFLAEVETFTEQGVNGTAANKFQGWWIEECVSY